MEEIQQLSHKLQKVLNLQTEGQTQDENKLLLRYIIRNRAECTRRRL